MPLTPAICTQCGAKLTVDSTQDAAVCPFCHTPFIVEKAINQYNITNVTNVDKLNAHVVNVSSDTSANTIFANAKTLESLEDYPKAAETLLSMAEKYPADKRSYSELVQYYLELVEKGKTCDSFCDGRYHQSACGRYLGAWPWDIRESTVKKALQLNDDLFRSDLERRIARICDDVRCGRRLLLLNKSSRNDEPDCFESNELYNFLDLFANFFYCVKNLFKEGESNAEYFYKKNEKTHYETGVLNRLWGATGDCSMQAYSGTGYLIGRSWGGAKFNTIVTRAKIDALFEEVDRCRLTNICPYCGRGKHKFLSDDCSNCGRSFRWRR